MPLHKKKPFPLAEPPPALDPGELVYQIRFTGEILRDYQDYLGRLNLYRQRVWTCKITGKTNLTYEEALVSERRAAEKVQQFPTELMAPVLGRIQHSTLTLRDLVDSIYTMLQEHLFEGLELHGKKDQSVYACKIFKIFDDENATRYEVGWLDKDKQVIETSILKAEDLIRKKPPCSRSVLKAFVRESTSQSAPWVIHEKLAKKHGISTEPPEDLMDVSKVGTKAGRKDSFDNQKAINKKRKFAENGSVAGTKKKAKKDEDKEEPVNYPIDDLLVQPSADDPAFSDHPSLRAEFKVPMDCVGDLLMIWDFCSSFGRLLNLWRFSLEDFENAICHKDSNLVLIVESHAAILRLLIEDEGNYFTVIRDKKRKSKITLITWTEFLCDFLEMEGREEFTKYVGTIKRGHYGLLAINVKLGIFRELVTEALTSNAIRARLDECIEMQQALAVKRKEDNKRRKEEQHPKNIISDNQGPQDNMENGEGNILSSYLDCRIVEHEDIPHVGMQKIKVSKQSHMNGEINHDFSNLKDLKMDNGNCSEKVKDVSPMKEGKRNQHGKRHKPKNSLRKQPKKEERNNLEKELEKLYIRTNSLGKDRNYNRYWFFHHEGRLFVESLDSTLWGYYTTKEELDALVGSLNPKGERERALQSQLEKYYGRISKGLEKRSKDQKFLLEEAELRRSTRVRTPARKKPAFFSYANKWKDD